MRPALVVFAGPLLSDPGDAALHETGLNDMLAAWTVPGAFGVEPAPSVRLYLSSDGGGIPPGVSRHVPRGDSPGARMLRATVEAFATGHDRVVVVGTDHPGLPAAFVGEAFRLLDEPFAVVLGPGAEGGLYLLGVNEVLPSLFDGLTTDAADAFAGALDRAAGVGQPVVLPPLPG